MSIAQTERFPKSIVTEPKRVIAAVNGTGEAADQLINLDK